MFPLYYTFHCNIFFGWIHKKFLKKFKYKSLIFNLKDCEIPLPFLSSFILGNVGIIAGLWSEKFDNMATVTNFVIVPLSFLSGTFYTIDRLPGFLQTISEFNPFFYMIDGFRYSFIGKADGSITIGLIYLVILSFVTWFITYLLYKKGYKIKS